MKWKTFVQIARNINALFVQILWILLLSYEIMIQTDKKLTWWANLDGLICFVNSWWHIHIYESNLQLSKTVQIWGIGNSKFCKDWIPVLLYWIFFPIDWNRSFSCSKKSLYFMDAQFLSVKRSHMANEFSQEKCYLITTNCCFKMYNRKY